MSYIIGGDSGAMVLLETITASNDLTIEFTKYFDLGFENILFDINVMTVANNGDTFITRFSDDAGVSWKQTVSEYDSTSFRVIGTSTGINGGATNYARLTGAGLMSNSADKTNNFQMKLSKPQDTSQKTGYTHDSGYVYTGNQFSREVGGGFIRTTTNAINGVQFLMNTGGNILTGDFKMYGVKG